MKKIVIIFALLTITLLIPLGQAQPSANVVAFRAADGAGDVCYAPCVMHWDAHTTTHSTLTVVDDLLFNLDYSWDFGDPGSGYFDTTGHSRNSEKGFIAAHVYDQPGTYTTTLTVTDWTGATDTWTDTVVVTDPSSLQTYCFSNDANFDGCPVSCPSANCVTTNSLDIVDNYFGSNRQLLLKTDDIFTGTERGLNGADVVRLGSFGTGNRPVWQTSRNTGGLGTGNGASDVAIWGIEFDGNSDYDNGRGLLTIGTNILVYDCKIHGYSIGIYIDNWFGVPNYVFIVDNELGTADGNEGEGYMVIGTTYGGAALGNDIGNHITGGSQTEMEHLFRLGQWDRTIVAHNNLGHGYIKHTSKMHGQNGINNFYWTYRDNYHICDEVWCIGIGPQNAGAPWPAADERVWYGIVEDNYFFGTEDDVGTDAMQDGIIAWASYVAIRNNICDATSIPSSNGVTCITGLRKRNTEPDSSYMRIYGNTMYRGGTIQSYASTKTVGLDSDNSQVMNNLLFATDGIENVVSCTGSGNICNYNLNAQNSPFHTSVFDDPTDFQLSSSDTQARNQGYTMPNERGFDFGERLRPGESAWDIGAWEYIVVAPECSVDGDCEDSLWCNGQDTCSSGTCIHEFPGGNRDCADPNPVCDEPTDSCVACQFDSDCDDSNDCTSDLCSGTCSNIPVSQGTPCSGGVCDGSGTCIECIVAGDCDDSDSCTTDTCSSGICSNDYSACDQTSDGCCPPACDYTTDADCSACITSSAAWTNTSLFPQTGVFSVEFDATPNQNVMDGLTGLSQGEAGQYDDGAVTIWFDWDGYIQAWDNNEPNPFDPPNLGWFSSVDTIPYLGGDEFHFRLEINISGQTFDAYVTPQGGSEQTLATNRDFRSASGTITQLDNWFLYAGTGTHTVCSFQVSGAVACNTAADQPACDGCVDIDEATAYISRWEISITDVTMVELIRALEAWKVGGCS